MTPEEAADVVHAAFAAVNAGDLSACVRIAPAA
jgi:hypothetical protein